MSDASSDVRCPRCGEAGIGRFCEKCGAALRGASTPANHLPRLIGGAALLTLVAFVAGVMTGRRSGGLSADDGLVRTPLAEAPAAGPALGGSAPDISGMSPEERASRLFNRVMTLSEQGKMDSARFFAPMAIQAYEMIGPVDAHAQYDIGVISAAAGDVTRARAEADSILAARPNHLLGLVLAIRAANLSGDKAAEARFRQRLTTAEPSERSALKEYGEHARDIDEALTKAGGASK